MIWIIVLAAGKSTRFRTNKLLSSFKGYTLIQHVVLQALSSKADKVLVVLGHDKDQIRKTLTGLPCDFVYNEQFNLGQSTSVRKGFEYLKRKADAVLLLLGDMPLISSQMINALIDEYAVHEYPLLVATYRGHLGHPILFDKRFFNEILNISEESFGLKAIVDKYRDSIRSVEASSDAVLLDIDHQKDLKKIQHRDN